jgi:hypothetical protein
MNSTTVANKPEYNQTEVMQPNNTASEGNAPPMSIHNTEVDNLPLLEYP